MGFIDDFMRVFGFNKTSYNNSATSYDNNATDYDNNNFDKNKPVKINNNMAGDEEKTPKLVISSVAELKKIKEEVKQEKKEDIESFLFDDTKSSSRNSIQDETIKKYDLPNEKLISNETMKEYFDVIINNRKLYITLGKDTDGVIYENMDVLSNILICGTVSSGKTTMINDIISSILLRYRPDEVKMLMIDPKKIELSNYNGIPHLLLPVITDVRKACVCLQKIANDIDDRYEEFSRKNVKNIDGYNEWIDNENKSRSEKDKIRKMPRIVVFYDSYMSYSESALFAIDKIADSGNKAGIYLVLSSNSCSNDIIPNDIKVNFPTRVCFKVPSKRDSISVLDKEGANELTGIGSFLFVTKMNNKPRKATTICVDEIDIQKIIDYTVKQQIAQYDDKWTNLEAAADQGNAGYHAGDSSEDDDDDDLYNDVVEFVITSGKASASLLQRRFKIGYNRAARLVDLLEEGGIIGPQNESKPREVLVTIDDYFNEQ